MVVESMLLLSPKLSYKKIKPCKSIDYKAFSGERGIRTPGGVTLAGFQDQCIRPLCHFSKSVSDCSNASANIIPFFVLLKSFKVFFSANFQLRYN